MAEDLNRNLSANALNDENLEQVTGGKHKNIKDKKGRKITAAADSRVAMEAEADVKGYAEATGRIW